MGAALWWPVGHLTGVSIRLKAVSPFLINIHCIAHRTNLAALQAAQCVDCKKMSSEIDNMVNLLAEMFKRSGKKKSVLIALQKELNDAQKSLQRFHKIRWLSRYQAISTLCDSLESVLVFFRDYLRSKDEVTSPLLYFKFRTFKYIYVFYFLADLLHSLSVLSKIFQYKYVNVTTIGSLIRTQIESICMLYVIDSTDLNQDTFNANVGYHVIPQYGPPGGYLQRLSSEIRGSKFHSVDMIRDPNGIDLEEALNFQKSYAEAVCKCLEARFSDNGIISAFKILNPSNMPSKRVGLSSWSVTDLEVLLNHYAVEKEFGGKILPPLVNSDECRREFFNFKLQGTLDWSDKTFKDVWSMIIWNEPLQKSYANLLQLAEIARCQCISTATCERAFSVQNAIKIRHRNHLNTKHLESIMRLALEGSKENFDHMLVEAIELWRNSAKWRYLYSNPEKYLSSQSNEGAETLVLENV